MSESESEYVSRREKLAALRKVAEFDPKLTAMIVVFGVTAAGLEAVGLGFILPAIELVQSTGDPAANAGGVMVLFVSAYQILNLPFMLSTVVIGVAAVMLMRYTSSFIGAWFRAAIQTYYGISKTKHSVTPSMRASLTSIRGDPTISSMRSSHRRILLDG